MVMFFVFVFLLVDSASAEMRRTTTTSTAPCPSTAATRCVPVRRTSSAAVQTLSRCVRPVGAFKTFCSLLRYRSLRCVLIVLLLLVLHIAGKELDMIGVIKKRYGDEAIYR